MADYAAGRECVRAAAGGFSPGVCTGMLPQKDGNALDFLKTLEKRRLRRKEKRTILRKPFPKKKVGRNGWKRKDR